MGVPDGWITAPEIWVGMREMTARNAQLKACGNGVVPQQAYAAIRDMAQAFVIWEESGHFTMQNAFLL